MSGRPTSVGATLAGGIQDVSALLPIIGTEQCETHVGSALKGGYLYATATPLSIFGSLGIVKAGISVLITSISISIPKISISFHHLKPTIDYSEQRKWLGAKLYSNAGFRLTGTVAPLIGMDGQRFKAETRLLEILDKKHIDNPEKLSVDWKSRQWNIMLLITTFFCAGLSLMPYIALLIGPQSWRPSGIHLPILYPILRVVGSCFATVSCQIIIQSRVISLMKSRILFMIIDRRLKTIKQESLDAWMKDSNWHWDPNLPAEQCLLSLEKVLSLAPLPAKVPEGKTAIHGDSTSPPTKNDNELAKDGPHVSIPMTSKMPSPPIPQPLSPEIPSFQENDLYILQQKHFPSRFRDTTLAVLSWMILGLSLPATVAGYIGCFTLVSATPARGNGPLVWVGLEVALSILRIVIWASNPSFDEETEITLGLELSEHQPMVTSDQVNLSGAGQPFPLTPEREFLEWITPFTGPLDQFQKTDNITLYFTLTTDGGFRNLSPNHDDYCYQKSVSTEHFDDYLEGCWGSDDYWERVTFDISGIPSANPTFLTSIGFSHPSLRLVMTVFDTNRNMGVTLISSKKSFFYFDATLKYNTISRQMEARRESHLRNVHNWRKQDDILFDSLQQYYQIIVGSFYQRCSNTTPRGKCIYYFGQFLQTHKAATVILPWHWDLTSNSGPGNSQNQVKDFTPSLLLPPLTEQDFSYLKRKQEHQLKIRLINNWSEWIVQDMKNLRSDARNDCHAALKDPTSHKGRYELTELDAQLAWGWARRELLLLKLSLELEDILGLKMQSYISAVHCARWDMQLNMWMSSEFENGRRERLERERGEAKQRMEEAMKHASEEADGEGRSWEDAGSFRPRWGRVIDLIDSQWRAGIRRQWAGWKDAKVKLKIIISMTHERQNRHKNSRFRFLEQFRLRVSHEHWYHQHKIEEQLMMSTIERIAAVPADDSKPDSLSWAYAYDAADREATSKFAYLNVSSSKGKACSAIVYDVGQRGERVVCGVIAKSTTRSVVNVAPEILSSIPPNDHLLFLRCSDGDVQEPDFVRRNRDRWWDQQTANSSMFYFTVAPLGDLNFRTTGPIIAHVLAFLTTPSIVQVRVIYRSNQNLLLRENGEEVGKICYSSESSHSTKHWQLQDFPPFVLQSGKHTLELAQETPDNSSHYWDILIELSALTSTFDLAESDDETGDLSD